MKTTNRLLILTAILCLVACKTKFPFTIFSNQVHVVTLYVNTNNIDQTNIEQNANFGQAPGISNEEYTTYVKRGDIVIWRGVSINDPLDIVNITIIEHDTKDGRSKNFFDKNMIRGNGDDHETVVGTLKKGNRGEFQKYILKFTVIDNGEPRNDIYIIDPKMHM